MKKQIFAGVIVLLTSAAVMAQAGVEASVDAIVKAEMERQKIPGISLAVIKSGKPLIVKGYGLANIEHGVAVKPETIFQSGSVGKQFTAFAVMLLVDEGKINLDEKIGKYLGEVPDAWANITVRHLLTHTSGMTDYPQDFDFRKDYTEDELLKQAKAIPVAFRPGEKWAYSNLGYLTLGVMISKITGKFYGEFLQERIFKPLGMTTARIINESDLVANRAAGYILQKGEIKNQAWVSPSMNTTADGSLYLSVNDMIQWERGLVEGKLLSKASYQQMWTPVRTADGKEQRYGFGWGLRMLNGRRVIEHSGAWQGFRSHIGRYSDNKLAVVVFANSANANPDRLANQIAAKIDPTLTPIPVPDSDPRMTGEIRRIFEEILKGKIDENLFAPNVAKALSDPQDRLTAHLKTIGPISNFEFLESREIGDSIVYKYKVEFDSMTVMLELTRAKDGKIMQFELHPE